MLPLRPYQQAAVAAATAWMSKTLDPALLDLATGSGKSFLVAAIAGWVVQKSGKKVLCIAPSKELTEQNHEKYLLTGSQASYYSASLGRSMRHDVVYGTPQTIANDLHNFRDQFAAVIVDECHTGLDRVRRITDHIKEHNPYLRVIGMTATPYRMGKGYVYQLDQDGMEVESVEPYFKKMVYKISAHELIAMGYLTPPNLNPVLHHYDTSSLTTNRMGNFQAKDIERAFEGHGRLTAEIVADVVAHSRDRQGVMLFASTVRHAEEILASLPPGNSRMLGGQHNMKKAERERLIADFKAQRFKYMVSVGTLTTGFDATHVDVVAVLRATESAALLQQILGRGLRLHDGKTDVLFLDYAENIERHQLGSDVFSPHITVSYSGGGGELLKAVCPLCASVNEFTARKNEEGYQYTEDGYFADLTGNAIELDGQRLPSHYGRRCKHYAGLGRPEDRCNYRWSSKECTECGADNDIAARYCEACEAEIIDPNTKLEREFQRAKMDPTIVSTDRVINWSVRPWTANSGRETVRLDIQTDYAKMSKWYWPERRSEWRALCEALLGCAADSIDEFMRLRDTAGDNLKTVTAYKPKNNRYYNILAFNHPEDIL